jgi:hypothetical protein
MINKNLISLLCTLPGIGICEINTGFNPMKEMQTIPGDARITVSSHLKTIFQDRDGAMGTIYLDSLKMGNFTREDDAFTQEVPPGKHYLEVCQHLWYSGDNTKTQCVQMEIEAQANTLYATVFRATLPLFNDYFIFTLDSPTVIPF